MAMTGPLYFNAVTLRNTPWTGSSTIRRSAQRLGLSGLDDLSDLQDEVIKGLIRQVKIESALTPPVTLTSADITAKTEAGLLVDLIKPTMTVDLMNGGQFKVAPGGPASESWPFALAVGAIGGGLAIYGLFMLLRRRR